MRTLIACTPLALGAAAGLWIGSAVAAPPPFTLSSLARSNQVQVVGTSIGASVGFPGRRGILNVAVNNSGQWVINVDTPFNQAFPLVPHEAIIRTQAPQGPFAPYLVHGVEGYLPVLSPTAVSRTLIAMAMNNNNDAVFAVPLAPSAADAANSSGVLFGTTRVIFLAGDMVNAPGLAAGTTFNAVDSGIHVSLNDTNQLLVVHSVTELGVSRRIVLRVQLDALGNVLSRTLLAKESGPVGAGPQIWTTIGSGQTSAALNNSGVAAFSGITSGGTDGIYSTAGAGSFVAVAGGPSPVLGYTWGTLLSAPLDLNNPGETAFRGPTAVTSTTFTEKNDAGEVMDAEAQTYGNGALNLIVGTLASDHDVDLFRINIANPAAFSATTVPDPGSGFAGAAFDTVLSLIREPGNGMRGVTQCDNVSPSVMQSTLTSANLPANTNVPTGSNTSFYLAISTPKSRCASRISHWATGTNPLRDIWQADPAGLAVDAGLVYLPIPAASAIKRATTAGAAQADLSAPSVLTQVAVSGGKVYWADRASNSRLRRSNLDGSNLEDIYAFNSFGSISANSCTGLAVDPVNGYVYWSRSIFGEISRINLDGQNPVRIIQDYPPTGASFPEAVTTGTFAPESIAIDTSAGTANKIYWVNSRLDRIERCNTDGTGRAAFLVGGNPVGDGAGAIAIDTIGGRIYWPSTAQNKIVRANLSGSGAVEDVALTPAPAAIALDVAGGFVYWTSTVERIVRRASIAGALPAAPSDVYSIGPSIGERVPDGPGATSSLGGWTRSGTPGVSALPYQIRLTGVTPQHGHHIIARNNTKIAATGDAVPGVANSSLTTLLVSGNPVRITDRSDVLWTGQYFPVIANNVPANALFFNQDRLLFSNEIPTGPNMDAQKYLFPLSGAGGLEVSSSGQYAIFQANMQVPFYNFTPQLDNALLFTFDFPTTGACCNGTTCTVVAQASCTGTFKGSGTACLAPGNPTTCCPANFDALNGVTVTDIFSFLTAWFAGNPAANFDGAGGVTVSDIFAFLTAWFAGCA